MRTREFESFFSTLLALNQAGLPVPDLSPADFEIEFDGRKVSPSVSVYISLTEPVTPEGGHNGAKPSAAEAQRVIVFFVVNPVLEVMDTSDLRAPPLLRSLAPLTLQAARRTAALLDDYVDRLAGPRDVVAIARAESRRVVLSELTTDRDLTRRAIRDIRDRWMDAPPINVGPRMFSILDRRLAEIIDHMTTTLEYIRSIPGRKIMFVSSQFLRAGRDFTQARDSLRRLREAANRSAVTIYGIDPTGLTARSSVTVEDDAQAPLRELAVSTGGRFIANTNTLEAGIEKALNENRGYYILGFDPGQRVRDRPGRIKVRALRDGVEVRVRETLAPDPTLRSKDVFLEGRSLTELANSPLSPQGLDVGLDAGVRWNNSGEPEVLIATTVGRFQGPAVKLAVLTRILNEEGKVVFLEERPMTLRPKDRSRPIRFSVVKGLGKPKNARSNGAPPLFQIDVAIRDVTSGASGAARRVVAAAIAEPGRLGLTPPVLQDAREEAATVSSSFAPGAQIVMRVQLSGAKQGPDGRNHLEIVTRFLRDGRVVKTEPAGRIESRLPDPFNLDGHLSLEGLDSGEYEITVEVRDIVTRSLATGTARFNIR